LLTATSFDFETKNSYTIRVRTTDQSQASFEKVFLISIGDVNEAPTAIFISNNLVAENQPVGTVVGTLGANDPDDSVLSLLAGVSAVGANSSTITFQLVADAPGFDNSQFTVDAAGVLHTAAIFNFEAKSSYAILVRATDGGGLSVVGPLTILVAD